MLLSRTAMLLSRTAMVIEETAIFLGRTAIAVGEPGTALQFVTKISCPARWPSTGASLRLAILIRGSSGPGRARSSKPQSASKRKRKSTRRHATRAVLASRIKHDQRPIP